MLAAAWRLRAVRIARSLPAVEPFLKLFPPPGARPGLGRLHLALDEIGGRRASRLAELLTSELPQSR